MNLVTDECLSSPCLHGSTCEDGRASYVCRCSPGYTGLHCETDINECDSSPCMNSAFCNDLINGYNCNCQPGWTGLKFIGFLFNVVCFCISWKNLL